MSSTLLEQLRTTQYDVDRLEMDVVSELDKRPKTTRETVMHEHRIAGLLDKASQRARDALELQGDADGTLKDEVASMRGPESFQNFYAKLKGIQEYHRKFPGTQIVQDEPGGETEVPAFSGEEFYGKYLDLAEFHNRYLNLAGVKRVDYAEYTQLFQKFDHVPVGVKQSLAYSEYIDDLLEYLVSFFKKTQPLVDIDEDIKEAEQEFERMWEKFEVPGWSQRHVDAARRGLAEVPEVDTTQQDAEEGEVGGVDLAEHDSAESLQALGMEALKTALTARGLKCGGSAEERASRLLQVKGVAPSEYPEELLATTETTKRRRRRKRRGKRGGASAAGAAGTGRPKSTAELAEEARREVERFKDLARREFLIGHVADVLAAQVQATRELAEKRLVRTHDEIAAEREEEEEAERVMAEESDEEEDVDVEAPIYNPKNVPLGWDGKPIPYWLYKLHGLRVEYMCEICGNEVYRGPRNYERHFFEWRHAHGMRCLGIPNTKHFFGVTKIKDALELYAKLRNTVKDTDWNPEVEEEFEDSEGNVMNKKTYYDLARQGLL